MKLKRLTIQNFLSIRSMTLDLEDRGLVLLQGRNLDNESLNNNGAGKSSIVEALVYALYGRTLRGLKGDAVVHRIPKKNMKIFLDLEDDDGTEYRIARYRKHSNNKNKSLLYRNGKDITPKSENDFNDYVANLLQADYLTFTSSLLYSAESFKFTSATDAEMKKTFDTMLGLDVYQRCQDIAKARLKEVESEIQSVQWKVDDRKLKVVELEAKIDDTLLDRDEFEEKQARRLEALEFHKAELERESVSAADLVEDCSEALEIAQLKVAKAEKSLASKRKKLKQVDELREALQEVYDEIREHERSIRGHEVRINYLTDEKDSYSSRISKLKAKIESLKEKKLGLDDGIGEPCPTCGQPITEDCLESARDEYDAQIAECMEDVDKLKSKIDKAHDEIQKAEEGIALEEAAVWELERTKEEFEELVEKSKGLIDEKDRAEEKLRVSQKVYYKAESDLKVAENGLKQVQGQLADVEKSLQEDLQANPYDHILEKYRSEQETYQSEVESLLEGIQEQLDEKDCLTFWVQAYSNQGIKSFILDDITPFLNRRANKYLSKLTSGRIEVKFNTQTTLKSGEVREKFSIDVINTDGGQEYSANSGGEKKRVDLAINLSMQDLVASRSSKKINVAIFDEAFDALDEVGIEKVIELLQELSDEKSSIFVISHNEHLKSYFTNVITVVKQGGFSTIDNSELQEDVQEDMSD